MKEFALKVLITIGIITGLALIPLFLLYVLPHFTPFILAYIVALLLEPFNQLIIKRMRVRRSVAVSVSFFSFFGSIALIMYFIITRITTQLFDLVRFIQKNLPYIEVWVTDVFKTAQEYLNLMPYEISSQLSSSAAKFSSDLANLNIIASIGAHTYNISTIIPNFFIMLILFFVSLFLLSLHLHDINRGFFRYFKYSSREKAVLVLSDLRKATVGFVQAQIILSTITFVLSLTGLLILNVRYALVIAIIIVLVDVLPILGSGSVLVPWAVFVFSRGNTFLAVGLVVLFLVINVIRRIIEPKILGERIGLSALSTLISIWIGFKVLGVAGVFLGPVLVILSKALVKADIISYRLKI